MADENEGLLDSIVYVTPADVWPFAGTHLGFANLAGASLQWAFAAIRYLPMPT